jgi:predicted TIM-barrel fold metal-dependent hydrolase
MALGSVPCPVDRHKRIVWGADDLPLNMSHQLGKVLGAQIPEEAKVQILSGNARRLLSQIRK